MKTTDRLDETISTVMYILDCLRAYKEITKSGNCNNCGKNPTCEYKPRIGQMVRYNCPFYERKKS